MFLIKTFPGQPKYHKFLEADNQNFDFGASNFLFFKGRIC